MNLSMPHTINWIEEYVKRHMAKYDASHDYSHIQRVLYNAKLIEAKERSLRPNVNIDTDVVTLSALLHDVGDRKYVCAGQDPATIVQETLLFAGCPKATAEKIQLICTNVAYSNETKNMEQVAALCEQHPELGIVQDADRLDAIGAVGIARMFIYTGAKQNERGIGVGHFYEKLLRVEKRMKTETGKLMARERTERMQEYLKWYDDEMKGVNALNAMEKSSEGIRQGILAEEKAAESSGQEWEMVAPHKEAKS